MSCVFAWSSLQRRRYAQITFTGSAYLIVMKRLPLFRWHLVTAKAAMAFAGNIYARRMVGMVPGYSADFLIGVLVNPAAAGAHRPAMRVVLGAWRLALGAWRLALGAWRERGVLPADQRNSLGALLES